MLASRRPPLRGRPPRDGRLLHRGVRRGNVRARPTAADHLRTARHEARTTCVRSSTLTTSSSSLTSAASIGARPRSAAANPGEKTEICLDGAIEYQLRLIPSNKLLGRFFSTLDAWPAIIADRGRRQVPQDPFAGRDRSGWDKLQHLRRPDSIGSRGSTTANPIPTQAARPDTQGGGSQKALPDSLAEQAQCRRAPPSRGDSCFSADSTQLSCHLG